MITNSVFKWGIRCQSSWIQPKGYDTGIKIYNCVAKKKVPFITNKPNIISWYSCGPTVYDSAHVGHGSCYIKMDIIQRILSKYFKFNILFVMNITDIDDKIITRSKELNKSIGDITSLYEKEFWEDMLKLKINKPNLVLKVSENLDNIIEFISELINKGMAYSDSKGSVYFKVKTSPKYGKLINLTKSLNSEMHKENELDFALWKCKKNNEPFWNSPWGAGRPGWHIECSALASKVFGSSIDVHAGGMDLKFPHHENEEVQSCAYHSCDQWVNYWLHIGQVITKTKLKMSKSLKNSISISQMLDMTSSDAVRLACAMSHYRSRMEYSDELLKNAERNLQKYRNFVNNCDIYILQNLIFNADNKLEKLLLNSIEETDNALRNDFDTPEVINVLNRIIGQTNPIFGAEASDFAQISTVIGLRNFFTEILQSVFNVSVTESTTGTRDSLSSDILDVLNNFRHQVRLIGVNTMNEDILRCCDETRSKLDGLGIKIKDLKTITNS